MGNVYWKRVRFCQECPLLSLAGPKMYKCDHPATERFFDPSVYPGYTAPPPCPLRKKPLLVQLETDDAE
jgi:hypothetical protein